MDVTIEQLLGRRPTPFNYACMSLLTYRDFDADDIRADTISDAIENDTRLPPDKLKLSVDAWHALRHEGWEVLEQCKRESGMICTVFFHSERQQLVFSYRGTQPSNFKSVRADVFHVMRDRAGSINDHAVEIAKRYAEHKVFEKYKFLQVSTTGHSLGAWEAELVVFQLKLEFALHRRELPPAYARIWAVTFESPGSRTLMEAKQNSPNMLHKIDIVSSLDITMYMSKPNYINTFNRQATTCLYQITGEAINNARNTIQVHDMATVYAGMQEALTEPKNIRRCLFWPYRPWSSNGQDPNEVVELTLKDMQSIQHLYTGKFCYPLTELPPDVQLCIQDPDKHNIPQESILRTKIKLHRSHVNNDYELELLDNLTLDRIKDEFFISVRIPEICRECGIDPELAVNFAATAEQENADSIVEKRYGNFLYYGQLNIHDQPHGFGLAFFDDESKYIGVWLRGSYYGYGIFVSGDPGLPFEYRGQFLAGQLNGFGMLRLHKASNDITDRLTQQDLDDAYIGEFEKGKFLRMGNAASLGLLAERQATKRAAHIISTCEKARSSLQNAAQIHHQRQTMHTTALQTDWLPDHFSLRSKGFPFISRTDENKHKVESGSILLLLQRAACACHIASVPLKESPKVIESYQGLFSGAEVQHTQSGGTCDLSQLVFIHETFKSGIRRRFIVFNPLITEEISNDLRSPFYQQLLSLVPMDYIHSWLSSGTQLVIVGHSIGGLLALILSAQIICDNNCGDPETLRKLLFCITLGSPVLPDTYTIGGSMQSSVRNVWESWCKTNRHFVLLKDDPIPALGVFLRKKEWPTTYTGLNLAGIFSSSEEISELPNLPNLHLGLNTLNCLKKEAISGTPWIADSKLTKHVTWKNVYAFAKDVQSMNKAEIQKRSSKHSIRSYVRSINMSLEHLKKDTRKETPDLLSLDIPNESETDVDRMELNMHTTITDVWMEVSETGTTHFCLAGRELRLLSEIYVLPSSNTTHLQLETQHDLPEGSLLIWSRNSKSGDKIIWEHVSVTDSQVDFSVKLSRSRVLTLLNLSESLVTPRHLKGGIKASSFRSKISGLAIYACFLLGGQVVSVSMDNITLPRVNSHTQSFLASQVSSHELAAMAYLKAVMLQHAALRLMQQQGLTNDDYERLSSQTYSATQESDTGHDEESEAKKLIRQFFNASSEICCRLDEACCFLDLSALSLAWVRIAVEEEDERKRQDLRIMFRDILLSYFRLGPYSDTSSSIDSAYHYKLSAIALPVDLMNPVEDLLNDVDRVHLPPKTCKWDGFLPDYSSLISTNPPKFRDEISTYSFAAALAHNPGSSENVLDPSSLHQTELLLHAEPALELFHIFFDGDFPIHSRRTVNRFWAMASSLPSTLVFSMASAVVRPFSKDENQKLQSIDRKAAYLRRHRQFQQAHYGHIATITGFNMKLALLARLLPSEASEFSCLSVVEEGIRHLFNNVFSVGALKTRLQRYEQDQEAKESASKISEFVKNMNSMGIYSQSNPHAFETICRWIYAVINIRQPLFEHLMQHPIIGMYGAQGAGKSLILNMLGFATKSAFGDGNTKAFDIHPIGTTGVLIADSFGFNEAVSEGEDSSHFERARITFGTAFLGQLRYVIYTSSSSSQRNYNKEEDESLLKLRNVPCHVLYLITKFDGFLKRFADDEKEAAYEEARRIIADRRERNRKALPGKTVETRFYSGITPHDCEKLVADAYQNLQGDFWQPDDLKQHLRKVLVLNCNIEPDSASSALGMVVDVSQDSIQMPLPSKPVY